MKKNNLIIAVGIFALILVVFISQIVYPSGLLRPGVVASDFVQSPDGLAALPDTDSRTLVLKSISPWQSVKKDPLASIFVAGYELSGESTDFTSPQRLVFTLPPDVNYTPFVFYEADGIRTIIDDVTFVVTEGVVQTVEISALGPGKYYLFKQHQFTDALPLMLMLQPEVVNRPGGANVSLSFAQSLYAVPYAHTLDTELGLGIIPALSQVSASYELNGAEVQIDTAQTVLDSQNITIPFFVPDICAEFTDQSLLVNTVFNLSAQELTRSAGTWIAPPSADWVVSEGSVKTLRYVFQIHVPIGCQ